MMKKTQSQPSERKRSPPVSLAPLSFEDALKALVATPPMGEKPKRLATRLKPKRKKMA
jgi:hypothetical protein